jgi:T5SS/PEP-CTERM-associated repeat protein
MGSLLEAAGDLQIGNRGEGFLTISNGGVAKGNNVIWSASENTRDGSSIVTVDGAGSLLEADTNLRVRIGTLDITNGGTARGDWVSMGTVDHHARVTVSGMNSLLESEGNMDVGNAGAATLTLSGGAKAEATGNIRIGYDNFNAKGTVYVSGESSLTAGGDITVGASGQGLLAGTGYVTTMSGNIQVANKANNSKGILSAGNAPGEVGNLRLMADKLILDTGSVLRAFRRRGRAGLCREAPRRVRQPAVGLGVLNYSKNMQEKPPATGNGRWQFSSSAHAT